MHKKPRIEPTPDREEDKEDAGSSDSGEVEDDSEDGSCGYVHDVEPIEDTPPVDDSPSESDSVVGQGSIDGAGLSEERVADFSEDESDFDGEVDEDVYIEDSSDSDMGERRSVAIDRQSQSRALFQESAVGSDDFNTAFLSLAQRHNLTYSSQGDILKLLSIVLPSPSNIPSSAHVLYKKYSNYKEDTILQHFCDGCMCPLEPGSSCKQQKCAKASRGVFVRIPLSMQLKERFDGTLCIMNRLWVNHIYLQILNFRIF